MSEDAVDSLFQALYSLTDIREIFRKTSPHHELTEDQKKQMDELIEKVRKNLDEIEGEMLE